MIYLIITLGIVAAVVGLAVYVNNKSKSALNSGDGPSGNPTPKPEEKPR